MKLYISFAIAYGVWLSAQSAISMLFVVWRNSARKMLNKRGPIIHPWDTPKTNSIHVPYELLFLFSACCLTNCHELALRQAN